MLTQSDFPVEFHHQGYSGIANAVTYMCCTDIAAETRIRISKGEATSIDITKSYTPGFASAVRFLTRKSNPMYLLDIPGEELIEMIIRRTERDWLRNNK